MRVLFSILILVLAGTAQAEPPRVATDVAPVHGLVSRVMAGVGVPDLVIPQGADPHGYAMRPSEARALSQADIVFWVGAPLTPWLADPIETLATNAEHISLSDIKGLTVLDYRTGARFGAHDHGHQTEEEKHHDHGHEDDEHAADAGAPHAIDGHLWLDPENVVLWLDEIAAVLAARDPENADVYRANADAAQSDMHSLSLEIEDTLQPVLGKPFIVFHDGYHYFEARFGIEAMASVTLGDASTASAARLTEVRDVVQETGATCALAEPRASTGLIQAVAQDSDLRIVTLDAIGVDLPLGPEFYPALLRQIAGGLVTCLSDD